jgi:hypothetical protein
MKFNKDNAGTYSLEFCSRAAGDIVPSILISSYKRITQCFPPEADLTVDVVPNSRYPSKQCTFTYNTLFFPKRLYVPKIGQSFVRFIISCLCRIGSCCRIYRNLQGLLRIFSCSY